MSHLASFAQKVRSDFPILRQTVHGKPLIYLDSAATTQKPQSVIDAITDFYSCEYGTVHRAVYHLAARSTDRYHTARQKVATFLGAKSPEEIVFTSGTTESINLVAHSFPFSEGDEILLTEMEHHSNLVPWQLIAQKKKLKLKFIPVNDQAELDLSTLSTLLTPKTKLLSLAHIANATGTLNPVEEIASLAHRNGTAVFLDAAQSAAHCPLDVTALNVDFLAFSGHKTYGPTGIGVLYGNNLNLLEPMQGGGDMIERVRLSGSTFQKAPLRFEAGTPPIAQAIGLGAALDYITALGLEEIRSFEEKLTSYALEKLNSIPGLRLIGTAEKRGAIVSFVLEGVHHLDLATLLDLEGIAIRTGHTCAQPLMDRFGITGVSRISFAPFNTFEEIDAFISVLAQAKQVLI